jgi:hypothetical protein
MAAAGVYRSSQRFSADKTLRMLFYSDLVWPTLPAERNPVVQHASWAADAAPVPIKTKPQVRLPPTQLSEARMPPQARHLEGEGGGGGRERE